MIRIVALSKQTESTIEDFFFRKYMFSILKMCPFLVLLIIFQGDISKNLPFVVGVIVGFAAGAMVISSVDALIRIHSLKKHLIERAWILQDYMLLVRSNPYRDPMTELAVQWKERRFPVARAEFLFRDFAGDSPAYAALVAERRALGLELDD